MKKQPKDFVNNLLETIDACQLHVSNLQRAEQFLQQERGQRGTPADLRERLILKELDLWRMVGAMALNMKPEDQDRIRAACHARFFSNDTSICEWLNGGFAPSQWLASDDEEFRAMMKKYLKAD